MSLGSRGRGRGALSLLRTPGDGGTGQQGGSGYKLMEARVTEIVDVDSFWAQIGAGGGCCINLVSVFSVCHQLVNCPVRHHQRVGRLSM